MPVTVKLSRKFYERLGDDVANEPVELVNTVDTAYRADLREMNELNFARFDAKVEQRMAESDSRWERRWAESDTKWERRLSELDAKWEQRLSESDAKWEHRMAESDAKWERRMADSDAKWEQRHRETDRRVADLRTEMREVKAELIKWTFAFVAGGTLTVLTVSLAILRAVS
ncbi:MAG TPA: hypothetical protein VFH97_04075 [Gemmatimonadales bacterium]|nr:hypothetical protein [Gemmatimonadales bacterium]